MPSVRVLLASQSPRRADLLRAAGIAFEIVGVEVDERRLDDESPASYVLRVARTKAEVAACRKSGTLVLAADTAVVVDGLILGKPADEADAARMLEMLSGRTHLVMTGVALCRDGRALTEVVSTAVRFLRLGDAEIAWYVATGEPRGKAGGYAIQGLASRFIDWIEGSYSNVVGLPVAKVYQLLKEFEDKAL
ncbi:MAG: septum formation inhibitor Maf [Acidobacteria bacterium]|nr:septum formation inhibitor Maf [Acidobacteriota bacterium]